MRVFSYTALTSLGFAALGIAFCIGCGDSSPQSWETAKHSSGAGAAHEKVASKGGETADNGDVGSGAINTNESDNPHEMSNPHAGMNPHAGVEMASGQSTVMENNGKLDIDNLHFTVPKSWVRKTPKSSMLQAEYSIPKAEGDPRDGRLTVSAVGGSVEGNIERWKSQFGDKPEKEKQETIDAGAVKITLIDLSGTFEDSMGPFAPGEKRPNYRMLGAIFQAPGDGSLHFVKCYGPQKTIAARADEVKEFLKSLKIDK